MDYKEEGQSTIDSKYSLSLDPSSGSLRDAWLRKFSQTQKIGKIYGESGAVVFEGKSPIAWLQEFKILDPKDRNYVLNAQELRALWVKVAEKYSRAASFHANLTLACEALASELEDLESRFIREEVSKYEPGGEHWSEEAGKPLIKRPPQAILENQAKAQAASARRALNALKREASFFYHCMMNLETQRRCFKDYAELLSIDPAARGMT